MMPGMGRGGMDPRQMKQMMKRLGITTEELDASEVVIRLRDRELVITKPAVTAMVVQGEKTYQVVGKPVERPLGSGAPSAAQPKSYPDEDIQLVAEQAGVSPEKARAALEATKGDLAEAIIKLQGEK